MIRPTITVTMYIPSCLATTSKSAIEMIFPQMRQAIPTGEYLKTECVFWLQICQAQENIVYSIQLRSYNKLLHAVQIYIYTRE